MMIFSFINMHFLTLNTSIHSYFPWVLCDAVLHVYMISMFVDVLHLVRSYVTWLCIYSSMLLYFSTYLNYIYSLSRKLIIFLYVLTLQLYIHKNISNINILKMQVILQRLLCAYIRDHLVRSSCNICKKNKKWGG